MVAIGVLAYIPGNRHRELLQRTLISIRAQLGAPPYSLSIIDNGNEAQATRLWLQDLAEKFQATLYRRENREIAAGRDMFLRETSVGSKFCVFVDSDIELPSDWLKSVVEAATIEKPGIPGLPVAVATVNRPPIGETAFNDALMCFFSSRLGLLGSPQALQLEQDEEVQHLSSCAVLIERSSAIKAGGYKCHFTVVCEDLELSYRLRNQGRLLLLARPAVIHRQDEGELRWWARMFRYGWGQIEVMREHREHILSLKLIPPLAMFAVVVAVGRMAFLGRWDLLVSIGGIYFSLVPVSIILIAMRRKRSIGTAFRAIGIAAGSHFSYALGSLLGVFGLFRNPPQQRSEVTR